MSTPFFSIILPVYNVERYLERSINSIKNQIEQNFEVILINDGSTDNSENKILDLIANDNRFSLINKDNEGSGPARNDGLRLAEGNYIYFMDPDDEIKKNLLDDCKKTLEKTQSDILMFGYEGIDIVNEKRYIISNDNYYLLKNQTDFRNEFKRILFGNSFNAVWNKMYKLEWLQSTGVYFPRMINAEDGKFNSDLLPYISSFEIIPKSYYIYYISRPDSIMTRYNEKFLDNELILINCFESSIRVWENYREFRSYINNYKIDILFNEIKNLIGKKKVAKKELIKSLENNLNRSNFENICVLKIKGFKYVAKYVLLKNKWITILKMLT